MLLQRSQTLRHGNNHSMLEQTLHQYDGSIYCTSTKKREMDDTYILTKSRLWLIIEKWHKMGNFLQADRLAFTKVLTQAVSAFFLINHFCLSAESIRYCEKTCDGN